MLVAARILQGLGAAAGSVLGRALTRDAYTFKEFQQMLQNSGYRSSELHPLPPTFFSVVIATK